MKNGILILSYKFPPIQEKRSFHNLPVSLSGGILFLAGYFPVGDCVRLRTEVDTDFEYLSTVCLEW